MKKLRTIIIVVVVAAIVTLSAVTAIIIARGGRLSEGGTLVNTGIIKVESKPNDVKVFVNGVEKQLQDKQIIGLEEGDYDIVVSKVGFTTWEKTVRARIGVVTDIYAQLFPTSFNISQTTQTNIDRAFFSSDGDIGIYSVTDSEVGNNLGLWRIRLHQPSIILGENKPIKLSNLTPLLSEILSGDYEMKLSPQNKFLLITDRDKNEYYIINAELYNEPSSSINDELGYTPDGLDWFENSSSLIVAKDNTLFEYNLVDKTSTLISLTPGSSPIYSVNSQRVFYYNHNTDKLEFYDRGKSQALMVQNITLPKNISEIYVSKDDPDLLLLKANDKFYYLNSEKSFLDEIGTDLTLIDFSKDGLSALFARGDELVSYTVHEFLSENRFESRADTIFEMYVPETQATRWNSGSTHILVMTSSDVMKTLDIYDRDGKNKTTLLTDMRISNTDFGMTQDGLSVYVLLNDEIKENGTNTVLRTNFYKIDLKTSNE